MLASGTILLFLFIMISLFCKFLNSSTLTPFTNSPANENLSGNDMYERSTKLRTLTGLPMQSNTLVPFFFG